jgi:hypothetical protein
MEFVYLLFTHDFAWEDVVVILSEEEAINASIKYPNINVEIFSKKPDLGYTPTYNYYKNGKYISNHNDYNIHKIKKT